MQLDSSPLRGLALTLAMVLAALGAAPSRAAPGASAKPLARLPAPRPIDGLIVKLKDAPAHEQALSLGTQPGVQARLQGVLERAGVTVARTRATGRAAQRLDFGHVLGAQEAAQLSERLAAQPEVQWVVSNTRERRLDIVPNDPFYASGDQWWLQSVRGTNQSAIDDRLRGVAGFASAWALTTGAPAVPAALVAVLDTGITCHEELGNVNSSCIGGHILPGYDFVGPNPNNGGSLAIANDGNGRDGDPRDPGDWVTQADIDNDPGDFSGCTVENSSWHGTNIAGLIGALTNQQTPTGVAAINWDARILPVRVAGKCGADVSDIVDGLRWAAGLHVDGVSDNANPARVINISFGGSEPCNAAYQDAIDEIATKKQAIVVAAAGNERGAATRPASCRGVVAVGAVNRDGFKSNYSNFGSAITLMAVGGDPAGDGTSDGLWGPTLGDSGLLTIDNGGTTGPSSPATPDYARVFGTSFSTPLVSGTASLMLTLNPNLTAAQLIDGLKKSARPHVTSRLIGACSASNPGRCICTTATCGAGLLDATQALLYARNPDAYVAPAQQPVSIDSPDVAQAVALGPDEVGSAPPPQPSGGGGGALASAALLALALAAGAARALNAPRRPRRSRSARSSRR
jgi:serine protease